MTKALRYQDEIQICAASNKWSSQRFRLIFLSSNYKSTHIRTVITVIKSIQKLTRQKRLLQFPHLDLNNGYKFYTIDRGDHGGVCCVFQDRYPDTWQSGGPAPNLQSFGEDVVRIGVHRRDTSLNLEIRLGHVVTGGRCPNLLLDWGVDCFLFGSRGGQVVLPILWQSLQNATPPRQGLGLLDSFPAWELNSWGVVVNGGCAMRLPGPTICWPEGAIFHKTRELMVIFFLKICFGVRHQPVLLFLSDQWWSWQSGLGVPFPSLSVLLLMFDTLKKREDGWFLPWLYHGSELH